ncbi:hypothetical protein NEOKW01_0392 [Nematocida sp. AWRm80]|nr:hypothetical protein NEOKW01_0392 [Nematocida sp. AWRm80]
MKHIKYSLVYCIILAIAILAYITCLSESNPNRARENIEMSTMYVIPQSETYVEPQNPHKCCRTNQKVVVSIVIFIIVLAVIIAVPLASKGLTDGGFFGENNTTNMTKSTAINMPAHRINNPSMFLDTKAKNIITNTTVNNQTQANSTEEEETSTMPNTTEDNQTQTISTEEETSTMPNTTEDNQTQDNSTEETNRDNEEKISNQPDLKQSTVNNQTQAISTEEEETSTMPNTTVDNQTQANSTEEANRENEEETSNKLDLK